MIDRAQAIDKPMVEMKSRIDRIRDAAYLLSLARSDGLGDPKADWEAAEAQIDEEDANSS